MRRLGSGEGEGGEWGGEGEGRTDLEVGWEVLDHLVGRVQHAQPHTRHLGERGGKKEREGVRRGVVGF